MMWARCSAALALLLTSAAEASSPSDSDVVWRDADWPGELGSLPFGNGLSTGQAWVEQTSGDLLMYLGRVDAFDVNAQPVHVGRVRLSFAPPLWQGDASDFEMRLDLARATVAISTPHVAINITADANVEDAVFVSAASASSSAPFNLTARVEPYRALAPSTLGFVPCTPKFDEPDVVLARGAAARAAAGRDDATLVWYHRNGAALGRNATFHDESLAQAGCSSGAPDPYVNLTFGAAISSDAASIALSDDSGSALSGRDLTRASLAVRLLAERAPSVEAWLRAAARAPRPAFDAAAHDEHWAAFWNRSDVDITARSAGDAPSARNMTDHYRWQRYLDWIQRRGVIKFNGQGFTVDEGKGPDYRDWADAYWWQNTRQPYYNALAAGDIELFDALYREYAAMIPTLECRVRAEFGHGGAIWPETAEAWGCYRPGDWGCDTPPAGPSTNTFIRFHYTGSLELCLMLLDDFAFRANATVWSAFGDAVCSRVVTFFDEHFPQNDAGGAMDMFPAQALETWQCADPSARDACVTNPSTDIAGLMAVLPRLLALPDALANASQRAAWTALAARLPPLPLVNGSALAPGAQLPAGMSNSENTELYALHPFRVFGLGKEGLDVINATYDARPHPCNNGWCQDVVDAAMLGLPRAATAQVAARASAGAASGWRFGGFAAHYQDYEPSLDHYSFMRTAMHYMLVAPLGPDEERIALFAALDTDRFDVRFKLHAPNGALVEAACVAGAVTQLEVTPAAEVVVLGCGGGAAERQ